MNDRFARIPRVRTRLIALVLIAAGIAALIALLTVLNGPIRWRVAGVELTNHSAGRPATVALVAWLLGMTLAGWRVAVERVLRLRPSTLAAIVAAGLFATGLNYASTVSAGSDAYGYVYQADLWLKGNLKIEQPWVADAPWPDARWSFAPLGTRPSPLEPWTIVPMYPPGLPLLMAGAKLVGGQEGVFWVVPITGAVLVLATFGIGRRLASPYAGLIGAWLVATSPAVLFMLATPMSDVPVAAACATSFYYLLDRRRLTALAAGAAFGLGIAIRPNLAPCAALVGLWYLLPFVRPGTNGRGETFVQGVLFSAGVLAGAAIVGGVHQVLNGSPFISTYGPMTGAFSRDHFWPNLKLYTGWFVETQTWLGVAGVIALFVPVRRLWPAAPARLAFLVFGLFALGLWVMYCFYLVFDVWWYLRFLLPTWPLIMVGTGAVVTALVRGRGRPVALLATASLIALGCYQVWLAADRNAFDLWQGERRYVSAAREVRKLTDRNSAIFSMQHSSSIRYYGGRVSVRYDSLEPAWIDRSVDWLAERGIRSYLLIDDGEMEYLRLKFAGRRIIEQMNERPLLHYQGGSHVYLFDLNGAPDPLARPMTFIETYANTRSVEPVAMAPLDMRGPR